MAGQSAVKTFVPFFEYESKQYLNDMVESPSHFFVHAERFGISLLTSAVYG